MFMLGPRIKEILKAEGKSTYRLSKDLHIDQAQLSRFFNGKGGISIKKIERILDFLGYEITFNKAVRGEEKKVKGKAPAPKRMPMGTDWRYLLKCLECNTSFDHSTEFGESLTNERLRDIECPFCFETGHAVVERPPTAFRIDTEKKRQVSQDKRKRKTKELPFKDFADREEIRKLRE